MNRSARISPKLPRISWQNLTSAAKGAPAIGQLVGQFASLSKGASDRRVLFLFLGKLGLANLAFLNVAASHNQGCWCSEHTVHRGCQAHRVATRGVQLEAAPPNQRPPESFSSASLLIWPFIVLVVFTTWQ